MTQTYPNDLFKGTAWYYARYRPRYPEAFLAHLQERFHLDGSGRLLDLGCGTGELAVRLAPRFEEAVGMDPEPEMLKEAAAFAEGLGVRNVTWIEGGSGDLDRLRPRLGTFRLVTMGESFHWMDRDATLRTLHEIVAPGGGVVISWHHIEGSSEWMESANAAVKRWLGEARRAGGGYYVNPDERHEEVVARSPFTGMEIVGEGDPRFDYRQVRDIDGVVGLLYSTSYASPYVLGDLREPFEKDLRQTLLEVQPSGEFDEEVSVEAILAWKEASNG